MTTSAEEVFLLFLGYLKAKVMFESNTVDYLTYARVDRQTQFLNFQYEISSSRLTHIFFTRVLVIPVRFGTLKCLLKMHFCKCIFFVKFEWRVQFCFISGRNTMFLIQRKTIAIESRSVSFKLLLDFLLTVRSAINTQSLLRYSDFTP